MNNVLPFAFKDNLVRVVKRENDGDEPWFVGRDVCQVLAIRNESDALARLDTDERLDGVAITDPMGREQTVIAISEPGVFRLIFTSRKPEAEEFKRWLAHDVLPKLRRDGFFALATPEGQQPAPTRGDLVADAPLDARVNAVRLGARLFGMERARAMWAQFGLPEPAPAALEGETEARECLQTLLEARAPGREGDAIARLVELAIFDSDGDSAALLAGIGIRAVEDDANPGFVVANHHPQLAGYFAGTVWLHRWPLVLRRLAGTYPAGRFRFCEVNQRGTFIPARWLDLIKA